MFKKIIPLLYQKTISFDILLSTWQATFHALICQTKTLQFKSKRDLEAVFLSFQSDKKLCSSLTFTYINFSPLTIFILFVFTQKFAKMPNFRWSVCNVQLLRYLQRKFNSSCQHIVDTFSNVMSYQATYQVRYLVHIFSIIIQ